jgi:hypothetical protein
VSEGFEVDGVAIAVFCVLFGFVTVLGFVAARWKRGDLGLLDEWGLGGRRFGTVITWFLLGGDLVTAYTFIAVPALVWAVGAGGFFALPYTILVFPFVFLVMPRLWAVASKHRYVTAADYVKGPLLEPQPRHGDRVHRPAGDDALHRPSARRHRGRAGRPRHRGPLAAHHRLRDPRRVHVHERPSGAGDDRARQRHADLRDGHRGDHLHPSKLGGWDAIFSSASQELP